MRVVQLGARLEYGDAITNHTLEIQKHLMRRGIRADIICDSADSYCQKYVTALTKTNPSFDDADLIIYHHSIYSEALELFLMAGNRKMLIYHNITPANYFKPYSADLALACEIGRKSLYSLTDVALAVGDSDYNRRELVEFGFDFSRTDVLPIFVHYEDFETVPINKGLLNRYKDGQTNFLFVGRVAPNKKFEDVIKVFLYYNRCVNRKSRLFLVGNLFLDKYARALQSFVGHLKLEGKVVFTNKVSLSDLKTYYMLADVFVSMSEHEGFCVPLVEAMHFGVPVVAFESSAVPGTLAGAGILVRNKEYSQIAETVGLLLTQKEFRESVVGAQKRRVEELKPDQVEVRLWRVLGRVGIIGN